MVVVSEVFPCVRMHGNSTTEESMKHTIHIGHNLGMYLKARRLGWRTLWTGEGIICMTKEAA